MFPNIPALFFIVLALAAPVRAADAPSDQDLVESCALELLDRQAPPGQPAGADHHHTVSSSTVQRGDAGAATVTVALTSGEGRLVQGTCIIRNGKIFDVRQ